MKKLTIKNAPSHDFASQIEKIPYRGYEVEQISDGRKIVIVKPGGKQTFGKMRKEDFFVFIYNPIEESLWQISHKQILEDIKMKIENSPEEAIKVLEAMEKVYHGADPDDLISQIKVNQTTGENPEVLLKAYKWIWGQEDVNYPDGLGRRMSWEGLIKENNEILETGSGLKDLLEELRAKYE
ncbi:MAG: glutamyl-tRNA amidotransferase [Rectinema subterraneum]